MICLGTGWFVVVIHARSALAGRYIAEAVNPEPTFSDERRQAGHERVHCKKKEKASRCRDEGATGGEQGNSLVLHA
jgi:hypothetical protein